MLELLLRSPARTVCLCVGVTLALLWWASRRLPPGPWGIPGLGCLWLMGGDKRKVFADMRKRYGDIFSFRMGTRLTVIVNGYDAIKETFVNQADSFSDRPQIFSVVEVGQGKGIVNNSGTSWWEHRKFTVQKLRLFGIGKTSFEDKVKEELSPFTGVLRQTDGQDFDPGNAIQTAISNIICSIVFGKRFEYDDDLFVSFLRIFEENMRLVGGTGINNYFPWLRYLPGDPFNFRKTLHNVETVQAFVRTIIQNHQASLVPGETRDFIDAYLQQMAEAQARNPNTSFQMDQLIKLLGDLFVGGTETTSTTLRWAIVFLVRNPEVQERMRFELQSVVIGSRWPSMEDRKKLPYTNAVISEVQRLADIAPFSVPHSTSLGGKVNGLYVPADSIVLPNIHSVLHDPQLFPSPEEFRPERFLDENGEHWVPEELIPFFVGRRQCPGMALAKMELFLFLSVLLLHFDILPPEDPKSQPVMDGITGLTYVPRDYMVRFIPLAPPTPSTPH